MKKYSDVLKKYGSKEDIPYYILLETEEWKRKREEILERDGKKCLRCGTGDTNFGPGLGHHELVTKTYTDTIRDPDGNIREYEIRHERVKGYEESRYLQVHHKYYVYGDPPWRYKDEALETVCRKCHQKIHKEENIYVYESRDKISAKKLTPCRRCGGKGVIPPYNHVKNGICFRCEGERFEEFFNN